MFLGSSIPVISAQIGLGLIFILRLSPNLETVLRNSFQKLEIMPQLWSFVVVKVHTIIIITMCLALILKD